MRNNKHILSFNVKTLRLAGWPRNESLFHGKLLVMVHTLLVAVLTFMAFVDIVQALQNGEINALGICTFYLTFDSLTFFTSFYINYEDFLELVRYLEEVVVRPRRQPGLQQRLIDDAERDASRFSILWFSMVMGHCIILLTSAGVGSFVVLSRQNSTIEELPLPGRFSFKTGSQTVYLGMFTYFAIAMVSLHISFATIEPLCISSILHLNAQFKILQHSLTDLKYWAQNEVRRRLHGKNYIQPQAHGHYHGQQNLPESSVVITMNHGNAVQHEDLMLQNEVSHEMKHRLIECIKHHNEILTSAAMLTSVYSAMMVVLVLVDVGILTIASFELTKVSGDMSVKFISIHTFLCALFHSCFYGYMSEQMAQQSQLVGLAAYKSDWLEAPLDIKKMLAVVIARSQRPVVLTLGKFNRLTMQTFLWTLRVAYSYCAILHQVYNRE